MSKERKRRREARQQVRAIEVKKRARARERRERWLRVRDAVGAMVPRPATDSLLARRTRRRLWWIFGSVLAVQAVAWPLLPSWGPRLVLLALCLLAVPVLWVLLFDRR